MYEAAAVPQTHERHCFLRLYGALLLLSCLCGCHHILIGCVVLNDYSNFLLILVLLLHTSGGNQGDLS
jgi:hypothetical protein